MSYRALRFEREDGVGWIIIDRPKASNALDEGLALELLDCVIHAAEDSSVRVCAITGEGESFCVGGDINMFAEHLDELAPLIWRVTTYVHSAISKLVRMEKPTIAAVRGPAAGGGMGIALACDLVVAGLSAKFRMAYPRIGLAADASTSYFLPRLVGLRRALSLTYLNQVVDAQEAAAIGLVTETVADDNLIPRVTELANQLAAGPTSALAKAKRLLHHSFERSLEQQMEEEAEAMAVEARGPNVQEGIRSFLEKRPPRFR